MVVIAITGSPAVGKSTISNLLSSQSWKVKSVAELAKSLDCEGEYDDLMGCVEIDIHKLAEKFVPSLDDNIIVDGHLSHFLEVDAIIILRCEPTKLRTRLESRGYLEAKVNANVEWELIAGTWSEIAEFEIDVPILELDTTTSTAEELLEVINFWIEGNFTSNLTMISDAIDWLA